MGRTRLEKHLFLGDFQIPDHNRQLIPPITRFIQDYKPDYLHLVGDIINLTRAGKYEVSPDAPTLTEEVKSARGVVFYLTETARDANKHVEIRWYCGNHEARFQKYIDRNADALVGLTDDDDEEMLTIPHIFALEKHHIEWLDYYDTYRAYDEVEVEHGDVARCKAGYTGQAMIDARGRSGFSGHTHKLCLIARNQGGDIKFWVECGSLCNPEPTPHWKKKPDWVLGFSVGIYDKLLGVMHPIPILIQKNSFCYNEKIYSA